MSSGPAPPPGPGPVSLLARLRALHPDSPTRRLRQWLEAGRVRVDGRVVRDGRTPVTGSDAVLLAPHGEPEFPRPLRLVHEDDAILVIDKPAGLLTIATERERVRTAYRLVWDYLAARHPPRRPFVVHRLDRDTSGLLVLAKSPEAKRRLQAQFEERTAERVYLALVEGAVRLDQGTLASTLTEDRSLRVRSLPERAGPPTRARSGRTAITRYRVVRRERDTTLLELSLGTGRRRQIRVQLAALGHPVVGDREHGARRDPLRRLGLHATRLGLVHPATGLRMTFESAAPFAASRPGSSPRSAPPAP